MKFVCFLFLSYFCCSLVEFDSFLKFYNFLTLFFNIQQHSLDVLRGHDQFWLQLLQYILHLCRLLLRAIQLSQSTFVSSFSEQHFTTKLQ